MNSFLKQYKMVFHPKRKKKLLKQLHVNNKMNWYGCSMVLEISSNRDLNYQKEVLEIVKLNSDIVLFVPLIS